jgi:hypothetical protein
MGDEINGATGASTRELIRQSIAASHANARRIDTVDVKLDELKSDVAKMALEDAHRVGYLAGAKAGARATLLVLAAALGGGMTKLVDYIMGK